MKHNVVYGMSLYNSGVNFFKVIAMLKMSLNELMDSPLGSLLQPDELELLILHSHIRQFNANEVILRQGKQSPGIYMIIEGDVISSARLMAEGIATLETLGPGSFFGEVSFIEKIPSVRSLMADTKTRCILLTDTYLKFLTEYAPETKYKIYWAICNQICKRLKKMHDKVVAFIAQSNMVSRSIFVEIIHSLTKPATITKTEIQSELKLLPTAPLFRTFTTEEYDELLNHIEILKAPKNCTLIRKSEKNASCYIVLQGAVQSSIIHNNISTKLSIIGPTTLFAGVACIDSNSEFTIPFTTRETAILFKINEDDMAYFQLTHPRLWYKLFDAITRSLAALEKSVDKLDIRLNIEIYNR